MKKITIASVLLSLLAIVTTAACAKEPAFERKIVIANATPARMEDYGGTIWWQSEKIKVAHATSLRLEFTGLNNPKQELADIVVRSKDQRELQRIALASIGPAKSFFTNRFFGVTEVRATIEAAKQPISLTVTLNAYYVGPDHEPKPLSMSSVEHPWDTVSASAVTQADPSRSVALLTFPDSEMRSCSGFLIGRDRIMTNDHCIALSSAFLANGKGCADVLIDFNVIDKSTPLRVHCEDAITDHTLDIAVLRIAPADVPKTLGLSPLKLATAVTLPTAATLIHHPAGMSMRISRDCNAVARVPSAKVQHTCSSLGGSSGAPLFNTAGEVIGVQSNGYPEMTLASYQNRIAKGEKFFNTAVDVQMIPKKFKEFN